MKSDEDPDAPPACDGSCGLDHTFNGTTGQPDAQCPVMLERRRYQYRRWARRHPVELEVYRERRRQE